MNYHYLTLQNQPAGPVSLDEVRALARAGTIAADPMVCPIGGTEWKVLSSLAEAAAAQPAAEAPRSADEKPAVEAGRGAAIESAFAKPARWLAGLCRPSLLEAGLAASKVVGHFAMLAGAVAMVVLTLRQSIYLKNSDPLLPGIVFVVILLLAQFSAVRLLPVTGQLAARLPSRVSSPALFDCAGVFAIFLALLMLVIGVVGMFPRGEGRPLMDVRALLYYLPWAVLWAGLGVVALHPKSVAHETADGSVGEDAIGVAAFFLKAGIKIMPLFFALFAVLGTVVLIWGIFDQLTRVGEALRFVGLMPLPGLLPPTLGGGVIGAGAVLTAGLLPLCAYLMFLAGSLVLEVLRAWLARTEQAAKL